MKDDVSAVEAQADRDLFETFAEMGYEPSNEEVARLKEAVSGIVNVRLKVGIFGQTGMGKSALCNALFGGEASKVSHGSSMTRDATQASIALGEGSGITLFDFPGLGEDEERDEEYKALYASKMPEMDLVLWMLAAPTRNHKEDIIAHREIVRPLADQHKIPVIFVVNQADRANPEDWDDENNAPSDLQQATIREYLEGTVDQRGMKQKGVIEKFGLTTNDISIVSATKGYGLIGLVESIVRSLPAEKKFGFVREAKIETVSAQAKEEAQEGLFASIKREVMKVVKEAAPAVIAAATKYLLAAGLKWLKSRK